jgi:signal transduction histidine kinase
VDVGKVQQIVTNLVANAIKFTHQEGVTVEVGAGEQPAEWAIKIIDKGIGMPPDAANYIFEKFRQVDSTEAKEYEGTGLGLAIVKSLLDVMGGRVTVETALGKGTTFTVNLPRLYQSKGQVIEQPQQPARVVPAQAAS